MSRGTIKKQQNDLCAQKDTQMSLINVFAVHLMGR